MATSSDLFDRRIDVIVYDEKRTEIARILTPEYGPKPEIKVEGTILSNTFQIAGKVTITNLERSIPVENAAFLSVEMYYGGSLTAQLLRKRILYSVLFADQSKQPPNRQVCFNCIVAGTTPDIMSSRATISKVDANNKPLELPLTTVLSSVISAYNTELSKREPEWYFALKLDLEPEFRLTEETKANLSNIRVAAQWTNTPLHTILDELTELSVADEPVVQGATEKQQYIAFNYYIENNKLVVAETPSNAFIPITGASQLEMNYVLSAYRYGPLVHVRGLFDPRIHQDVVVSISAASLSGKKVAGNLIPLFPSIAGAQANIVLFRPVGGIQFAFSTTSENWMQMQGTLYL